MVLFVFLSFRKFDFDFFETRLDVTLGTRESYGVNQVGQSA